MRDMSELPVLDQIIIRAVARNAHMRAGISHALDALQAGDRDFAALILTDLLDVQ